MFGEPAHLKPLSPPTLFLYISEMNDELRKAIISKTTTRG